LLHISELSDGGKVTSVEDVLQPGMKVEVRVIRVDTDERKIGLSFVHADFEENDKLPPPEKAEAAPTDAPPPPREGREGREPREKRRGERRGEAAGAAAPGGAPSEG